MHSIMLSCYTAGTISSSSRRTFAFKTNNNIEIDLDIFSQCQPVPPITVKLKLWCYINSTYHIYLLTINQRVVTVIEIDTETAVFQQNRTEPKPRFYAFLLTVLPTEQL